MGYAPRAPGYATAPRVLALSAIVGGLIGLVIALAVARSHGGPAQDAAVHAPVRVVAATVRPATAGTESAAMARLLGNSPADTLPFRPDPGDRPPRPGEVPSLYDDGLVCSTGCRPYGAELGWPLAPFHQQHAIRAALNELRPGSLHVGLDIQAPDGAPVYAVQPGYARVLTAAGPNARVQVGNYVYWHINPSVHDGELVTPFQTVLGTVMSGYGHVAFSEVDGTGNYVNPLRPGGSVLAPYVDETAPVIGAPAVASDGQVITDAYSAQTFVQRTTYVTPVLAVAGLAYRLYNSRGEAITPLEWAFRGTHLLPWSERSLIYAPGAGAPGFDCFATRPACVPHWRYRVADGLAPPLPTSLPAGSYRLTIYAWNWVDHVTALDTTLTMTTSGWRPLGHFPSELFKIPGYYSRSELEPPARNPLLYRLTGRGRYSYRSGERGTYLLHSYGSDEGSSGEPGAVPPSSAGPSPEYSAGRSLGSSAGGSPGLSTGSSRGSTAAR